MQPQGWNLVQTNLGIGAARVELGWDLISPGRSAAIAEADDSLRASRQRYADRLRQLQLDVSVAYYGLQLADQLQRIRKAMVDSDTVVRDQVAALKQVGLVPRLDLLRAEAVLQQSRYRLEQAEALRLSRQRQLSNLINVPFDVTLTAIEAVRLQPPGPSIWSRRSCAAGRTTLSSGPCRLPVTPCCARRIAARRSCCPACGWWPERAMARGWSPSP